MAASCWRSSSRRAARALGSRGRATTGLLSVTTSGGARSVLGPGPAPAALARPETPPERRLRGPAQHFRILNGLCGDFQECWRTMSGKAS